MGQPLPFIVQHIVRSRVGQSWISHFFLMCCSYVLQLHLFALFSMLLQLPPLCQFLVDVMSSLLLHDLFWTVSWAVTQQHKAWLSKALAPLFNPDSERQWMKTVALTAFIAYGILLAQGLQIDKDYITVSLLHCLCCHYLRTFVLTDTCRRRTSAVTMRYFALVPNTRILDVVEEGRRPGAPQPRSPRPTIWIISKNRPRRRQAPPFPTARLETSKKKIQTKIKKLGSNFGKSLRRKLHLT